MVQAVYKKVEDVEGRRLEQLVEMHVDKALTQE